MYLKAYMFLILAIIKIATVLWKLGFISSYIRCIRYTYLFYKIVNISILQALRGSWACVPLCCSCVWLSVTPWTIAWQASLSMGFPNQEYWSGWQCPPSGDLPDLGIEPVCLMSPALVGGFFTTSTTQETPLKNISKTIQLTECLI